MDSETIIAIIISIISLGLSCFFYHRGIRNEEIHRLKDSLFNRVEIFFDKLLSLDFNVELDISEIEQQISNDLSIIKLIDQQLNKRCKLFLLPETYQQNMHCIADKLSSNDAKDIRKKINEEKYTVLEKIEELYTEWFLTKPLSFNFVNTQYMILAKILDSAHLYHFFVLVILLFILFR
ncbi:hypothetical protein [Gilliamella sp. Occ4-3]|uniref:hypothetical protein n=1 Tax=Gilliamella sp. Occ4-3 TaxID=3120254 RepID=UPI00080EABB3|nr:hypothetical protein [Gilliamella apicola]OCG76745.1 hypothetical protein A9G44_00340 [Gilliamella apicola]